MDVLDELRELQISFQESGDVVNAFLIRKAISEIQRLQEYEWMYRDLER